jgi:(p)ppGpp synthase/HD superfamily hydrolase
MKGGGMIYTEKIQKAIRFATKTHEVYQKQKRKGKDIAYITHPLTVGLILCRVGACEDVVVAGILHDTIEDSPGEKRVDKKMLQERFGDKVADLVMDVTEKDKELPWRDRKEETIREIETFSYQTLLLKSADVVANMSELVQDYYRDGNGIFEFFNASREEVLENKIKLISVILAKWQDNPLGSDLRQVKKILEGIQE